MDNFASQIPALLDLRVSWLLDWAISAAVIVALVLAAWWLHALIFRVLTRAVSEQSLLRRSLLSRTEGPARLAAIMLAIAIAVTIAPLSADQAEIVRRIMIVGIIVLVGWFFLTALHVWMVVYLRRFKLDAEDNLLARKHVTQSRIMERIAKVLIVIVTLAVALMTFEGVRQYGVSLLASAGAASIVVELALQPMLRNLIAGVQLAMTQPIRIDDALLIEGEWGNVEEITSSYVVIRLWDWRRLIVPLNYFIEQPFQNWTRESSALIGAVLLYVDFTVPVTELRKHFEEIVRASKLWDGRVQVLQVTDLKESTMEIRMLASASSSPRAFDLRCEIREKMIAFVQQRYPEALPRGEDRSERSACRGPKGRAKGRPLSPISGREARDQGWPGAPFLANFSGFGRGTGMRGILMVAVLAGGLVLGPGAWAQVPGQTPQVPLPEPTLTPSLPPPTPAPEVEELPDAVPAAPRAAPDAASPSAEPAPSAEPPLAAAPEPPVAADPVVTSLRATLADPAFRKDQNEGDLAALEAFYAAHGTAVWVTEMGLTAKGQAALFEIERAGDWGLKASDFDLPQSGALPANEEAQALAELKLSVALLKYARHARGGRFTPSKISSLFDQRPPLRDPNTVLVDLEAADAPDAYIRALHPKHEQFELLRQALLKAREEGKSDDVAAKRLIINMERWRWMPEDLGSLHVWNNSPEFMLYVVKDGKRIYADKILVGTIGYATPVFTADMKTIVFNPDWIAPETVVKENIVPPLQRKSYSILKSHRLFVSYQGKPVDATKVDWNRVNPLAFTFSQKAGPHNNLGKVKFLYPNRHTVYMHDTLPVRKKYFKQSARMIGHECVRMEQPLRFAEVLLAEANGTSAAKVKELWEKSDNGAVSIGRKLPVHMVYFTAMVDESGKVETVADSYGLDHKMAVAMFDSAAGFPQPPPESKQPPPGEASASTPAARRTTADNDFARAFGGFVGD